MFLKLFESTEKFYASSSIESCRLDEPDVVVPLNVFRIQYWFWEWIYLFLELWPSDGHIASQFLSKWVDFMLEIVLRCLFWTVLNEERHKLSEIVLTEFVFEIDVECYGSHWEQFYFVGFRKYLEISQKSIFGCYLPMTLKLVQNPLGMARFELQEDLWGVISSKPLQGGDPLSSLYLSPVFPSI